MEYILKHTGDKIGIAGSILCLIHCLIAPFIAISGTALASHWHGGDSVWRLDYIFLIISGAAVYYATRHVADKYLKVFLWLSFFVFSGSLLLESKGEIFHWLSYVGSFMLIAGHFWNIYSSRTCKEGTCKVS